MTGPVVSVVMPLYNSEAFVVEAVESVLAQSYDKLELIAVDDCSTDASAQILAAYARDDARVRLLSHEQNRGAAAARNTALEQARGRYIAFLDADDVWLEGKLEEQIRFMAVKQADMCFTAYETIEVDGTHRNFVKVPERIDYRGFLKNTVTCCHTMMIDLTLVNREWVRFPVHADYDYPEDMAMWLQLLKRGATAYGLNTVLAKNRKRSRSRSARKLRAVKRTWNQYRRGEGLGVPFAAYCLFWQLFHAVLKRI